MDQTYTPNLSVKATAGWCLAYIDDAGKAPNRTATARYSWEVERNAGRIRTDTIPDGVWVVGWLDFTSGLYQSYGHVFFIKRSGSNYQIYDSEVQSGQRKPYNSLKELLAWFGAYKPIYLGWSTHCDGREYAKLKEDNVKIGTDNEWRQGMNRFHHQIVGNWDLSEETWNSIQGREVWDILVEWSNLPSANVALVQQEQGELAIRDEWPKQIYSLQDKVKSLETKLSEKPKETIVEKPVEIIKEVLKEVPIEKIVYRDKIVEVVKGDDERSLGDLLSAAYKKLFKIK